MRGSLLLDILDGVWAIHPAALSGVIEALDAKTPTPRPSSAIASRAGSVAIIPLHGVMSQRLDGYGETSTDEIRSLVQTAAADPDVKAIVLHVDSPGGSVYGVRELGLAIRAARGEKPVVAQIDSVAASAAYWAASQASEVVITPGGDAGSIGVYTMHQDVSKAMEGMGVSTSFISAGDYKTEGNPFAPLSEEARAALQARVDQAYADFVGAVAFGRGVSAAKVKADYGKGRMLAARDALAAGMVDKVGTFDETLARLARPGQASIYSRRARVAAAKAAI